MVGAIGQCTGCQFRRYSAKLKGVGLGMVSWTVPYSLSDSAWQALIWAHHFAVTHTKNEIGVRELLLGIAATYATGPVVLRQGDESATPLLSGESALSILGSSGVHVDHPSTPTEVRVPIPRMDVPLSALAKRIIESPLHKGAENEALIADVSHLLETTLSVASHAEDIDPETMSIIKRVYLALEKSK
jgi:hypothetical protein